MDVRKLRLFDTDNQFSSDHRDEYEKDYARLIQSPAFRRLQGKAQVFGAGTGDYYRTRLTHSIEVAQITREVARRLNKTEPSLARAEHPGLVIEPEVVEVAALAHDLGHPPFGHKGEYVLDAMLRAGFGKRFEANAQNFRILMFLEKRTGSERGLDLTAAVLLGINKYPHLLVSNEESSGAGKSAEKGMHEGSSGAGVAHGNGGQDSSGQGSGGAGGAHGNGGQGSGGDGDAHGNGGQGSGDMGRRVQTPYSVNGIMHGLSPFSGVGMSKGLYPQEWEGIAYLREQWQMPRGAVTLEAQLMDICDDIAYSSHDIEDGIRAGKIQMNRAFVEDELLASKIVFEIRADMAKQHDHLDWSGVDIAQVVRSVLGEYISMWEEIYKQGRHMTATQVGREMKARWVGRFAQAVGIIDDATLGWRRVTFVRDGAEDLSMLRAMEVMKKFAWATVIQDFRVQRLQKRSEIILGRLWDTFIDEAGGRFLLPPDWVASYDEFRARGDQSCGGTVSVSSAAEGTDRCAWSWPRLVSDFISGMTDTYAEKVYGELFAVRNSSIYERE
jgi:dGTP triphosphohydrolase